MPASTDQRMCGGGPLWGFLLFRSHGGFGRLEGTVARAGKARGVLVVGLCVRREP